MGLCEGCLEIQVEPLEKNAKKTLTQKVKSRSQIKQKSKIIKKTRSMLTTPLLLMIYLPCLSLCPFMSRDKNLKLLKILLSPLTQVPTCRVWPDGPVQQRPLAA